MFRPFYPPSPVDEAVFRSWEQKALHSYRVAAFQRYYDTQVRRCSVANQIVLKLQNLATEYQQYKIKVFQHYRNIAFQQWEITFHGHCTLALWRCRVMALQRYDVMALQSYGVVALRRCRVMALQRYDVVELQRCIVTALQSYDVVALRRSRVTVLQRYDVIVF